MPGLSKGRFEVLSAHDRVPTTSVVVNVKPVNNFTRAVFGRVTVVET